MMKRLTIILAFILTPVIGHCWTANGDLYTSGGNTIEGTQTLNGYVTLNSSVAVDGTATFADPVIMSSTLAVTGNAVCSATITTVGLNVTTGYGIFDDRVGVGIDSPGVGLEVEGSVRVRSGEAFLLLNTVNDNAASITNVGPTAVSKLNIADALWVIENGEVGIGTENPTVKLHVVGKSSTTGTAFVRGQISTRDTLRSYKESGSEYIEIDYGNSGGNLEVSAGGFNVSAANGSTDLFVSGTDSDLDIFTGTTRVIHIDSNGVSYFNGGNVGIGEIEPAELLQISTATGSSYSLGFAGAFQTLPTSGHEEGTQAYQVSDHTLYISTETVSSINSWKAVW